MAYLQWRAVTRLVELSSSASWNLRWANGRTPPRVANAAMEQSNARLFGAMDHLQRRILELEQAARGSLAEKSPPDTNGKIRTENGASTSNDREECVANLLTEGQKLMDTNDAEKALECFDVALGLDAKNAEALVKKGGALEKLGRMDEAIACYDCAIEANNSATIAYLQKGGLFNRLARYDEALQCYEQALRTQEKKGLARKKSRRRLQVEIHSAAGALVSMLFPESNFNFHFQQFAVFLVDARSSSFSNS